MAISKNMKVFEADGQQMQFNARYFAESVRENASAKKISISLLCAKIAREVSVSEYAVDNWRKGKNGPSDLVIIQKIARVLGMEDWKVLMREPVVKKELSARQMDAVKRVYDAIIDFLEDFNHSDGFCASYGSKYYGYWDGLDVEIYNKTKAYEYADYKYEQVTRTYNKEWFDLHDTEIYERLGIYIYGQLSDTYDGKLSSGYRYTAPDENQPENPTSQEDYQEALDELKSLIVENIPQKSNV